MEPGLQQGQVIVLLPNGSETKVLFFHLFLGNTEEEVILTCLLAGHMTLNSHILYL